MGGVMRAGIHATRLGLIEAEIARCGFYLYAGNPPSRIREIVHFDGERMHIDVSVRTIVGTLTTANTPVLDNHFEGITATNRADRAADHAEWISALPARSGYQIAVETKSFTNQAAHAIVSVGA